MGWKGVFKPKQGANGEVEHYKTRLVAKRFRVKKYGEDFNETFAFVVKNSTRRMLLSVAASRKMYVKHLDVKTAFLYAEIAEELFMEQALRFINQEILILYEN